VQNQMDAPPQILAISLIGEAGEFLEAARQLQKGGVIIRLMKPQFHLLCHCIELLLKAHLAASGVPNTTLRKRIGHDIQLAFRYGRRYFGFVPADDRFPDLVRWLAPYHLEHIFRYPKPIGFARYPRPSEAAEIIENTIGPVDQYVHNEARKALSPHSP
jgi:hypothetical protein